MNKVLMVDNYDSFTFNIVQYLGELNAEVMTYRNDEITLAGIRELKPDHLVISPGPCSPAEAGVCVAAVVCGNGKVEAGEECDDGNTATCDGCEACQRLSAAQNPLVPAIAMPSSLAGADGTVEFWMRRDGKGKDAFWEQWVWSLQAQSGANIVTSVSTGKISGYLAGWSVATNIIPSTWTHVALQRAGNTCAFFVQGALMGQGQCDASKPTR